MFCPAHGRRPSSHSNERGEDTDGGSLRIRDNNLDKQSSRFPVPGSTVPRHPAHVSFADELLMHCVAGGEGERLVARLDEFEVVAELLAVRRIGAVLDHCMCTLA